MSDHPAPLNSAEVRTFDWNDRATIRAKDGGGGLFDGLMALHHGTLAQMVAIVAGLPTAARERLVIQKAGDHQLDLAEILALACRSDFPARG